MSARLKTKKLTNLVAKGQSKQSVSVSSPPLPPPKTAETLPFSFTQGRKNNGPIRQFLKPFDKTDRTRADEERSKLHETSSVSIDHPFPVWRIRSPLLAKKSQKRRRRRRSLSDLLTTPSTWHSAHVTAANFDRPLSTPTTLEMGCKIDPRLTASRLKRLSYRVLTKRRSGGGIWRDRQGERGWEKREEIERGRR